MNESLIWNKWLDWLFLRVTHYSCLIKDAEITGRTKHIRAWSECREKARKDFNIARIYHETMVNGLAQFN